MIDQAALQQPFFLSIMPQTVHEEGGLTTIPTLDQRHTILGYSQMEPYLGRHLLTRRICLIKAPAGLL
jgi:hypothetical protein